MWQGCWYTHTPQGQMCVYPLNKLRGSAGPRGSSPGHRGAVAAGRAGPGIRFCGLRSALCALQDASSAGGVSAGAQRRVTCGWWWGSGVAVTSRAAACFLSLRRPRVPRWSAVCSLPTGSATAAKDSARWTNWPLLPFPERWEEKEECALHTKV